MLITTEFSYDYINVLVQDFSIKHISKPVSILSHFNKQKHRDNNIWGVFFVSKIWPLLNFCHCIQHHILLDCVKKAFNWVYFLYGALMFLICVFL